MKKTIALVLSLALCFLLMACGDTAASTDENAAPVSVSEIPFTISEDPVVVSVEEKDEISDSSDALAEDVIPENSYRSELTNEWISCDIQDQRPVAVMIDNESVALPHYGTSDADIIYEMMNSTLNGRITRFMAIYKDWENVEQIGNIRSARPTNMYLYPEYNAILVHDGGPFYINDHFNDPYSSEHLSSGFARIDRGKADFYEEYATNNDYSGVGEYSGKSYKSLYNRIKAAGYSLTYNSYYLGKPFTFSDTELSLKNEAKAKEASFVDLPFPHNASELSYDEKKGTYVYREYDEAYVDALYDDGRGLEFKNVILMKCAFEQFDKNGYMCYYILGGNDGYYITDGYAIPIKWSKSGKDDITSYTNAETGEEITLNTGKTYIAIVPDDAWSDLVIE